MAQPVVDGGPDLGDPLDRARPHLAQVARHRLADRVIEATLLQPAAQPVRPQHRLEQLVLLRTHGPQVEVRRVAPDASTALSVEQDELEPAVHHLPAVVNGAGDLVLKQEQHRGDLDVVLLVREDRALLE